MFYFCLIIFVIEMSILTVNGVLPDYIHVCHRNESNINECIIKSVEVIRPKLREGIPELNVPAIEPLHLGNIYLQRGPQGSRVNLNVTNLKAWGPSTFVITSMNQNIPKNFFEFKILIPNLLFKGRYSINMNVLLLKLKGNGNIDGNFTNFAVDVKMQGQKIQKKEDNTEHLFFNKMHLHMTVKSTIMRLEGLFGQDPVLNKIANDILEQNSEIFFEEIRPALEQSLGDAFTKMANGVTGSFTYDELFPY